MQKTRNIKTGQILRVFENFRQIPTPIDEYESAGKILLADKIDTFVQSNDPIEFVMLGLPFKSVNTRDKVIGVLPDLGEQAMIEQFSALDKEIKGFYSPGSKITIASDGFVFNDILKVNDHIVDAYKEINLDMAEGTNMMIYDLREFWKKGQLLSTTRGKLTSEFGVTPQKMELDILKNPDTNFLYRGMIRFMEEEFAAYKFPSNSQLHKHAKSIAREMMFRNEAFSNLVSHEFSNYVRLSMHPTVNNGKYSMQIIPGKKDKIWSSPWHCSILLDEHTGEYETIHRKDADGKFPLIYKDGKPYYFSKV